MSGSDLVLLAGPGDPTLILYTALKTEFAIAAVILEEPVSRARFLRNRVRRLGPVTVAGQLVFQAGVVPALKWAGRERTNEILRQFDLRAEPIEPSLLRHVPSANSDEAISHLRELRPRVVVVSGTRILSRRLLESIDAAFLNMHAGITPEFRGVHGGYWALAEQRPERCGVTIHRVDTGVDTGTIVGQALIEPTPEDNFATYPLLQLGMGIPIMKDAIRASLEGRQPATNPAPPGPSRQWYHPTAWGYAKTWIARGVK